MISLDRVYGALIGQAVGDALGAPTEGLSRTDIQETWGWVDSFVSANPAGTDDTEYAVLTAETILRFGSGLTAADVSEQWRSVLVDQAGGFHGGGFSEMTAIENLRDGLFAPRTGTDNHEMWSDGTAMRIAPIGIFAAGDPAEAARLAGVEAQVSHGRDGIDCGQAIAASVATALITDSWHDVVDSGLAYIPSDSWTPGWSARRFRSGRRRVALARRSTPCTTASPSSTTPGPMSVPKRPHLRTVCSQRPRASTSTPCWAASTSGETPTPSLRCAEPWPAPCTARRPFRGSGVISSTSSLATASSGPLAPTSRSCNPAPRDRPRRAGQRVSQTDLTASANSSATSADRGPDVYAKAYGAFLGLAMGDAVGLPALFHRLIPHPDKRAMLWKFGAGSTSSASTSYRCRTPSGVPNRSTSRVQTTPNSRCWPLGSSSSARGSRPRTSCSTAGSRTSWTVSTRSGLRSASAPPS